jgi:serine/threonine-protein kinase RsbW
VTDLCERLGLDSEQADDIRLAVTEACTNCVLHSQGDAPGDATFVLDAHVTGDELVIVVRDFGGGLLQAPVGSGGLGLGMRLIEQLSASSEVSSRPGGGTRVSMHFSVPAGLADVPAIANSLQLGATEIDAVGLVQRKGTGVPVWSLTMRGRLYRTG